MDKMSERRKRRGNLAAKEITFIVTKDCQLACRYCYEVGKNRHERMDFETARRAIDYILSHQGDRSRVMDTSSVVFDFIGGEPLLEVDLIERICDYIEKRLDESDSRWKNSHVYSLTTNGINYGSEKVQRFIARYHDLLHITLTIDGTKRKHDMNRVWKSDPTRGSYDDVVKNVPLWLSQCPDARTKVTVSHPDLPYIHESVMHLFSLGIRDVDINCVYEDVWEEGDDKIYEKQLMLLAASMIDKGLWRDHSCSFFEQGIGHPLDNVRHNVNCCGAGRTLAVDAAGIFYPCIRLAAYSLRSKPPRVIGSVHDGIDPNRIRPFLMLERTVQSPKECIECEVASGCVWCQGENYDSSDSGTIFHRSTAICRMHKARVRANRYYWRRLSEECGLELKEYPLVLDSRCVLQKEPSEMKRLTVILDDTSAPVCRETTKDRARRLMDIDCLRDIRDFSLENPDVAVFITYPDYDLPAGYQEILNDIPHRRISRIGRSDAADMTVIDDLMLPNGFRAENRIYSLIAPFASVMRHLDEIDTILSVAKRLIIRFDEGDLLDKDQLKEYDSFLASVLEIVDREWRRNHFVRCNILTDELFLKDNNHCEAGDCSFAVAPDGKFYVCPLFYFSETGKPCGDIRSGISLPERQLYQLDHSKACRDCNARHCSRCVYDNLLSTCEVNTPSYDQCRKALLERKYSKMLRDRYISRIK